MSGSIAAEVLSEHERTVLRMVSRRGVDATLKLYRQYRDRASLEAAVTRMGEKVARARGHEGAMPVRPLEDVLFDLTGVKATGPAAKMSGAAARPAPHLGAPPAGSAAAPETHPSSSRKLDTPAASPASAAAAPLPAGSAREVAAARRSRILELLGEGPRSVLSLAHALGEGENPHVTATALTKLKAEGKVRATIASAHDWPGASGRGRPSRVYALAAPSAAKGPPEDATSHSGASSEAAGPVFWRCTKCGFDRTPDVRGWCDKCQQKRTGEVGQHPADAPEALSGGILTTWPCGRCGRPHNTSDLCLDCGARPHGARPVHAIVPSLRTHPVELDDSDSAPPPLAVEVAAARAIVAALDDLTPVEREKALHLALGARESAARLARYRMGVEAIELALPPFERYPQLAELVRRVLQDDPSRVDADHP